ncbi:nuclear nucleic acid-binding protein C1D-like [Anopheles darlingi]|uniref:nuclear nucleic acid-binding protein C1D-like n=1 Tax=Anopheles darlingi TaxID=43151 RepID=UPI002100033F|nr:nuclear nucleic acid-binding protein C1D-like [Anopheles darlingi]
MEQTPIETRFGVLCRDVAFIRKDEKLQQTIEKIGKCLKVACEDYDKYHQFSIEEKVLYDNYITYSVNSLFWMHRKLTGKMEDNDEIKHELEKVRSVMVRMKEIKDNATKPQLDRKAAKRFIRAGLYDAQQPHGKKPKLPTKLTSNNGKHW